MNMQVKLEAQAVTEFPLLVLSVSLYVGFEQTCK
jgi:hypothetical protein